MKKLILFFLASIVLISCNKKVTLKGRVLNPVTNQGIEGFTIAVSADTWELPGGAKPVGQTTSGADGSFVLKFKKSGYDFSVYKEGYYNIGWYQNGEILPGQLSVKDKGKNMKADFYAVPYGKLHWHIKNVNCEGITDSLWFKKKYEYGDDFIAGWEFANPFVGCTDFSGNGTDKEQMGNHIIKMKIKRQSGTVIKYDTVFVNKDGITYYELFY